MANLTYGTPEFYAEQFSDFLADVQADDSKYGDAIVEGLLLCIKDWRDYHANQVNEYNRIEQRVRKALAV
jgi:hypothetical protein